MTELLLYGFVFVCGVAAGSWLMVALGRAE